MSEVAPLSNLTSGLCKKIEAKLLGVCAEVAAKHGLVTEGLCMQAVDLHWNFEFGMHVSNPLLDGPKLDPDLILFEEHADEFGLMPYD